MNQRPTVSSDASGNEEDEMCNLDPTYEQDDHRTIDAYMKEAEKIAEKKLCGETMASLYNKYKRARVANVEELREDR